LSTGWFRGPGTSRIAFSPSIVMSACPSVADSTAAGTPGRFRRDDAIMDGRERPGGEIRQTRWTQNPLSVRTCGFESRPGHPTLVWSAAGPPRRFGRAPADPEARRRCAEVSRLAHAVGEVQQRHRVLVVLGDG